MKFQAHILKRMGQRGISEEDIIQTLENGWPSDNAKEGTYGKTFVFLQEGIWEEKAYSEKEITIFYKVENNTTILLTAIARYGKDFKKEGELL